MNIWENVSIFLMYVFYELNKIFIPELIFTTENIKDGILFQFSQKCTNSKRIQSKRTILCSYCQDTLHRIKSNSCWLEGKTMSHSLKHKILDIITLNSYLLIIQCMQQGYYILDMYTDLDTYLYIFEIPSNSYKMNISYRIYFLSI